MKAPKTILLVNNAYPSKKQPKKGGYIKSIEDCLIEANLLVDKLVLDSNYNTHIEKVFAYLKFYIKMWFFKDYSKYDYIYIHHYPHVFVPLLFHFKKMKSIVVNFHGGDIVGTNLFLSLTNKIAYQFLPKKASYIVPSEYFKNTVLKTIPKLKKSNIVTSPSGGVNIDIFNQQARKQKTSDKTIIGFASGIDINKGIEDLLVLLERFDSKSYEFHVIDYGKNKTKYSSKLKSYRNVVLFKTFRKNDMPKFYSEIDVLFFPSKSESLGLVALEAMGCNVPVIGPDDFALSAIIVNGVTGEKYNSMKDMDYLVAFKKFEINRELYNTVKFVKENYSKDSVVRQFKQIFN